MASFNEDGLKKKLDHLSMSQDSIQTLSLWLIHHKKHANTVVNFWFKELSTAPNTRKLAYLYLANDVIQNSKKKGPEYNKEFGQQLSKVFEHLGTINLDEKSMKGVKRLLKVWEERGVFDAKLVAEFHAGLEDRLADFISSKENKPEKKKHKKSITPPPEPYEAEKKKVKKSISEDTEQPSSPPRDPPKPEQLIEALQDLENAATADADVREKISNLPKEISDLSCLNQLQDAEEGRALVKEVDNALSMLEAYNKRLTAEMESRKSVARMLHDYIAHQKDLLSQAEETLEDHRQKLLNVQKVQGELKAHMQNLPDISKLPNLHTGGLQPLPSAGDLFT